MRKLIIISILLLLVSPAFSQWHYRNKPCGGIPVNRLNPIANGLVGAWLFNGSEIAYDLSGSNNNGTLATSLAWITGDSGPAVEFGNSNGDAITIANAPTLDLKSDVTVIFRYYADTVNSDDGIIGNDFFTGWFVSNRSTGLLAFWAGGTAAANRAECTTATPSGQWVTLAVSWVKNTKTAYFYHDGVLINSATTTTDNSAGDAGGNIYIGEDGRDGSGFPADGKLEWMYVFDRTLSSNEIAAITRQPYSLFGYPQVTLWESIQGGVVFRSKGKTGGKLVKSGGK
jgi:hypothetical protein